MALRLIEMVLQEKDSKEIYKLLEGQKILEHRQVVLTNGEVLVRILLSVEHSEAVLDLLEKKCGNSVGNRVLILPVDATLPRDESDSIPEKENPPERISREELYENIKDAAKCTRVYLIMLMLSTIVASIGLQQNSVALIIGAMVMAPLLGPNMALALGSTLGDFSLLRRAFITDVAGIATTIVLSVIIGTLMNIDLEITQVASSMRVSFGNILVALASGCAGALSFTTAVSSTLVGVMVAVALLPPLVTFGLMLGGGQPTLAMGAFSLFLMNLICVNLAGVITFLMQGIHPISWQEKGRATKAIFISISMWIVLLAALILIIFLFKKDLI